MAIDNNGRLNIRVGRGVSRRDLLKQVTAAASAGALGGLAGCSALQRDEATETQTEVPETQAQTTAAEQTQAQNEETQEPQQEEGEAPPFQIVELIPPPNELDFSSAPPSRDITMVTHDASTSFFVPTIAGLHDAARQLGWNANFTGPTSGFDVQRQVSILESAVASGPDVIATTIADPSAYNDVIQQALDDDIFVVLYNTSALERQALRDEFGRALAFTGQQQVAAGYVCGLTFLDKLPDDASLVTIGTCCPGHSALEARSKGIELAINLNSDIELTNRVNYTGTASEGVSKLENHITANPDLGGIVGTDAFTWFIGEAINNQNAVDDIVGGGFDLTQDTLQFIQDEVLKFTIGQDPYSQGYIPTVQAFEYLDRGMPAKNYDTAAEVIDTENIGFARERSGGWDSLRNWQQNQ
jgi:ABC-type sugar transport system substrate-binding protein